MAGCLAQQQHAAAAKLLLNSPDREHRAAQQLIADLLPKLVDEARSFWEQQALAQYHTCAVNCGLDAECAAKNCTSQVNSCK